MKPKNLEKTPAQGELCLGILFFREQTTSIAKWKKKKGRNPVGIEKKTGSPSAKPIPCFNTLTEVKERAQGKVEL